MIFEIDNECINNLNDEKMIFTLERLATNRRLGKNHIVASRMVFDKLKRCESLSIISREVYKKLGNNASEQKILLDSVNTYIRVITDGTEERIVKEVEKNVILVSARRLSEGDFVEKCLFVVENVEDYSLYIKIFRYYRKRKGINTSCAFDLVHGGGSTLPIVLKKILQENNRLVLCIVDSDKRFESDEGGETINKTNELVNEFDSVFLKFIPLRVHEIENLVPLVVIKDIYKNDKSKQETIAFIEFLQRKENESDNSVSPYLFFDYKCGIKKKNVSEYGSEKDIKYNLDYSNYWDRYVNCFFQERGHSVIICGFGRNMLKKVLDKHELIDNKIESRCLSDEILEKEWMDLGENIFSWGCAGSKIIS